MPVAQALHVHLINLINATKLARFNTILGHKLRLISWRQATLRHDHANLSAGSQTWADSSRTRAWAICAVGSFDWSMYSTPPPSPLLHWGSAIARVGAGLVDDVRFGSRSAFGYQKTENNEQKAKPKMNMFQLRARSRAANTPTF